MNFILSSLPLEQLDLKQNIITDESGAFNSFEGLVRNHNEGRSVLHLEYEAYEELCHLEMKKIFQEAQSLYSIVDANCYHRIGQLKIGDMAVWVGVSAHHRDAAFSACRYIIDELKNRLPIWKKEFYTDGDSGWINAQSDTSSVSSPKPNTITHENLDSKEKSALTIDIRNLSTDTIVEYDWIDVRESYERIMFPLYQVTSKNLPFSQFSVDQYHLDSHKKYILFCAKGIRSLQAVQALREHGIHNVFSLDNDFKDLQTKLNQLNFSSQKHDH